MANYVVYNAVTGEILRCGECGPNDVDAQAYQVNESAILGIADDLTQRVDINQTPHVVINKSAVPYMLNGITLSGLPNCTATVEGANVSVTDGVLNISLDVPGTYDVLLQSPTHLDTTVQVTIV